MPKLKYVNTENLDDAIKLGCRTMCNVFNADDNNVPYFASRVYPEAYLGFSAYHSESHVPGRHLNALLTAQAVLCIQIDDESIKKHSDAVFLSYSGAVSLPLNREKEEETVPYRLIIHNIREGFYALYSLVKYRNSSKARNLAEKSIAEINKYWSPDTGWDTEVLESLGLYVHPGDEFIPNIGRAIGPLTKYYKATGYTPALELALKLKEEAINEYYRADGNFSAELFKTTHTHSVTCVLTSLAQLGDLLRDAQLIERVKAFYDNGLWKLRDELGWAIESYDPERNPDRGETNSTGDILETALILGKWGYTQYYEDAERIIRGHLLPSQLRDVSFIRDPENPEGKDCLKDVANRHLGAFGFPAPYGHCPVDAENFGFNMDIVGGTVASLCEAYKCVANYEDNIHRVNLLFDIENENISIQSPYTHDSLIIIPKKPGSLFVRMSSWADKSRIKVEGAKPGGIYNGYLFFSQTTIYQPITISFELVEREIILHHRTRNIRVRMRGDSVAAMDSFGMDFTFFDNVLY